MNPQLIAALKANASAPVSSQGRVKYNPNTGRYELPKEKVKGRGGFLSSTISEAGGAGGALLGAKAGALGGGALGSIVPVVGTGIGALAGGIIGAGVGGFAGGFGGRAVENKVRDDEYRLGDALKEGGLSGAFGVAGTGFQAARGLKAVGGLKGLQAATAAGGDDALRAGAQSIVAGGKRAGTQLASGGFDDLAKSAQMTAGRNTTERTGNAFYRSVLGVDDIVQPGKAGPRTLFKNDELVKEAARLKLKGTPSTMLRQVNEQYGRYNVQVGKKLAESKGSVGFSQFYKSAYDDVVKKLPIRTETGVPVKEELLRTFSQLKGLSKQGKLTPEAIHKFKNSLDVDSAFRKVSGELSSPLTAKETVDMALWREADNWITKLAPEAKELTKRQSNLYGLSQGLTRMTRTPGDPKTVVDFATRIAGPSVRRAQAATARGLMSVGGAQAGAQGLVPGAVRPLAKGMAVRGIGNQVINPSAPVEPETQGFADPMAGGLQGGEMPLQEGLAGGMEDMQQAPQSPYSLEAAIADIQRDPKNANDYMKFYEFVNQEAEGVKLTAQEKKAQQQASTALQGLNQLKSLYGGAGGGTGRVEGIVRNLTGKGGANSKANAFNQIRNSLTTTLARAFGETGVLTDQDREVYLQALPRLEDNPEEAAIKLQYLEEMLAQAPGANRNTPDLSSLISQAGY